MASLLLDARQAFHQDLISSGALIVDQYGVASNADKSQKSSIYYANHIAKQLQVVPGGLKMAGQTAGVKFEQAVQHFVASTFLKMSHLRPGSWEIRNFGSTRYGDEISRFEPYTHLVALAEAISRNPTLQSALGNAYTISPDVVVTRKPESDSFINSTVDLVDRFTGTRSLIRAVNNESDIDCVYPFALTELQQAVAESQNDEANILLANMVAGNRLKDISDLPLDLTI